MKGIQEKERKILNCLRCAQLWLDKEGELAAFTIFARRWPSYKIARINVSLHNSLVTNYGGKKLTRQAVCMN
jgi:hypothetical protein